MARLNDIRGVACLTNAVSLIGEETGADPCLWNSIR
jgi:hypothetical protein